MIDKKPIQDMPNKAFGDKHFASEFNTVKQFLLKTADAVNEIPAMIASDSKGEATPTSSPTPWAPGDPALFEKWEVKVAGTYTNFKDENNQFIIITEDDFKDSIVQIWVTNGVAKKEIIKLPEVDYNMSALDPDSIDKAETGKSVSTYFKSQIIPPKQTSFLKEDEINLFDKNAISIGYLNNGVFSPNTSYLTSDYIPVVSGDVIRTQTYINWACYDANQNLIIYDTVPGAGEEFTIPNDPLIAFVRTDAQIGYKDSLMIVKNIPYPPQYVPYGDNVIDYKDENFKSLIVSTVRENQLALREKHLNLLDTSKLINGFMRADGSIDPNAGAKLTDYIPVTPGKRYIAPGSWDSGYFDQNKGNFQLVTGVGGNFLIPNGVYFMRVAIPASALMPDSMIYETTQNPVDFIPYELANIVSELPAEQLRPLCSPIRGKKWGNIGDSIANFGVGYKVIIPSQSNCETFNYAVDGASYAPKSGQTMVISEAYVNMANDLDIITVHAGVNDVTAGTPIGTNSDTTNVTFKGALNVTFKGLIKKYLGRKIGIITPIQREGNSYLLPYVDAIKEIAKIYGLPVLDLNSSCGLTPDIPEVKAAYFDNIGLHPNRDGHKVFANKIQTFLESL
ncbi:lipolytic protein G-D-S-L family [Chryseobacterium sp. StRB126]|nr:lipolytic protein G-D-S-L family [Chryseobacterium sp. StRB126]